MEDFLRYAFDLPYTSEDIPVSVGRLAVRYRAAENVVYLPLAYVVLQCILRPTHSLKKVLSYWYGTYDQLRPLKWVRGIDCLSSLRPQVSNGPISWSDSLCRRSFAVLARVYAGLIFFPLHSALRQKFQRTVGQPLGFLSSWPLFTLTTHYLAGAVSGGIQAYAMKGDDIVIGDSRVAEE